MNNLKRNIKNYLLLTDSESYSEDVHKFCLEQIQDGRQVVLITTKQFVYAPLTQGSQLSGEQLQRLLIIYISGVIKIKCNRVHEFIYLLLLLLSFSLMFFFFFFFFLNLLNDILLCNVNNCPFFLPSFFFFYIYIYIHKYLKGFIVAIYNVLMYCINKQKKNKKKMFKTRHCQADVHNDMDVIYGIAFSLVLSELNAEKSTAEAREVIAVDLE
uniref:Uncharacterized protein n=1 Tax=Glossina morsitans morsitans TaxID=37546 RepID=A0A1B0FKT2_GLOMM